MSYPLTPTPRLQLQRPPLNAKLTLVILINVWLGKLDAEEPTMSKLGGWIEMHRDLIGKFLFEIVINRTALGIDTLMDSRGLM